MEKLIYLFLPSILFINFYIDEKDRNIDIVFKFLKVNLIINFINYIVQYYCFETKVLKNTIFFSIRYVFFSIIAGLIVTIVYKFLSNLSGVRFEVVNEKEVKSEKYSKKNKK